MDNVASISMGTPHNAAITTAGELYMWGGNNSTGELRTGVGTPHNKPVKVMDHVDFVKLGFQVSASVTSSGELYTWGCNIDGTIGNGTKEDQFLP